MLVYEERMDRQTRRLWLWREDYMREWCGRAEFRAVLPELLERQDAEFRQQIERVSAEERERAESAPREMKGVSTHASQ